MPRSGRGDTIKGWRVGLDLMRRIRHMGRNGSRRFIMNQRTDLKAMTRLALLVAIELVMKAIGLGSVPMGPLYMSFLTLPIAVGAITMGPLAGTLLGGVIGADSLYDGLPGGAAVTRALLRVRLFLTV